jgi:putative lipoic acid-binding regulatory protein
MDDKWKALQDKLAEEEWPQVYMFKFIVPADNKRIAQVEDLFNTNEAQVSLRKSKKGNFVSVTAKEMMLTPESVIDRYRKSELIEGLISL